ncbi:CapA family protein [Streptomyces sp. NPDC060194]|uniref:CapA family protein n=1 Tax=Streptomyces sp. NPDC060194 TaxID=3347069 RepID=UPI003646DA30
MNRTLYGVAAVTTALLAGATACSEPPKASLSAPPAAKTSATPSPAPKERGFTLVASGDVLPHASIIRQAKADAGGAGHDFRPMLAGARPVVEKADLAICHMETVYGPKEGPFSGYPSFVSPPEVAAALRATGYDSCSTASNHTLDAGAAGIRRTLGALDAAGIAHAGSARTAAESRTPAWLKAGTAKVAQLAYTYGTNGYPTPPGQPWAVNQTDRRKVIADAKAARKAGADVVVVSLHWGSEWQDAPDDVQLRLGRALTASTTGGRPDIDLILGTHAHVPQAYEKVNGTWIVYGMGDQVAGLMINYSGAHDMRGNQSSIGRFTFAPPKAPGRRWEVAKAEFLPQFFDPGTNRANDLTAEGAGHGDVRDRISKVVLSRGAADDGLVMGR